VSGHGGGSGFVYNISATPVLHCMYVPPLSMFVEQVVGCGTCEPLPFSATVLGPGNVSKVQEVA